MRFGPYDKDAFRDLNIPPGNPAPALPVRPGREPETVDEIARELVRAELRKKLETSLNTPASVLTATETSALLKALKQEDRDGKTDVPAVASVRWESLTPEELEQVARARDTLRTDPTNVEATMVYGALRAKAALSA